MNTVHLDKMENRVSDYITIKLSLGVIPFLPNKQEKFEIFCLKEFLFRKYYKVLQYEKQKCLYFHFKINRIFPDMLLYNQYFK